MASFTVCASYAGGVDAKQLAACILRPRITQRLQTDHLHDAMHIKVRYELVAANRAGYYAYLARSSRSAARHTCNGTSQALLNHV